MALAPTSSRASPPSCGRPIFQPPCSSAPVSPLPNGLASSGYFSSRSLKRARPNSSHGRETPSGFDCPTPSDAMYDSRLVNERYRLAGGFDTPGILAQSNHDGTESAERWDRGVLRDLDMRSSYDKVENEPSVLRGPLARERNGVARMKSSPNGSPEGQDRAGWGDFAFGLVGKVFNFGTSVIKGFYAGPGLGYDLQRSSSVSPRAPSQGWIRPRLQRGHTPVPGAWHDDDFLGDFEQDNPHSSPSLATRPVHKRRQTDKESWVVIGTPDLADSLQPRRQPSGASVVRSSLALSRASSRRVIAPVRRTSSYVTHIGSPAAQHQLDDTVIRRASFAHTRSSISRPENAGSKRESIADKENWPSPEAERFVRRQVKQGKAADKAMSSMSKRLEDLIRQGQEALGTKVTVEDAADLEVDEGFVDDDWH